MAIMTKIDTSKTTWDLSPLLDGDDDPKIKECRKEIEKAVDAFTKKWRDHDDYLRDATALKEALDELEKLEGMFSNGNEDFYFGLRSTVDSIDPKLKAKANQADEFMQKLDVQLQFFWLRIGDIDSKLQPKLLNDSGLQMYRHALERIFAQARYRLSEPEEKIMTFKSRPAHADWVKMTSDAITKDEREVTDESGKRVKATEEQIMSLMGSKQKPIRDEAAKAFNALLNDHLDMGVAELNAIMGNKKIDDELRGYTRPDQSRHLSDDMDSSVVDALVAAVSDRNEIPRRFYKLRAKLVGLPKLAYHERNLDYGSETATYSFHTAAQLVADTFQDLDPEFGDIFTSFLKKGQIDVFPRKGKVGGAFCAHLGPQHPTYVLLNHTDKIRDVMTIAHEMGHAINNELMRKQQNALNFHTSLSTAEVASTYMEDFVLQRLLAEADPETELALRVRQLDDTIATTFRQIAFYRFEQELHRTYREIGYVPGDQIGELFRQNLDSYMGEAFSGLHDAKNWWLYVGHFRAFFYVYTYASGLLISKSLQAKTRENKAFVQDVKTFLGAGVSQSPQDIFADMRIDITDKTFWEQGLNEIDQLLKDTEALAKKLGKI